MNRSKLLQQSVLEHHPSLQQHQNHRQWSLQFHGQQTLDEDLCDRGDVKTQQLTNNPGTESLHK